MCEDHGSFRCFYYGLQFKDKVQMCGSIHLHMLHACVILVYMDKLGIIQLQNSIA